MAKEKKHTAQTVRVPLDMDKPLGHRLVDTGESFQSLVLRLLRAELAGKTESTPAASASHQAVVATMPGLLDGLSDDDISTVHNLVEILKAKPEGSIFKNLHTALRLAITDYHALRSAHAAAETKATRESSKPQRKPTGTGPHHR